MGLSVKGILSICSNGSVLLKKVATWPFLKNLLQNKESFEAESWYVALGNSRSTKFVQMMILG